MRRNFFDFLARERALAYLLANRQGLLERFPQVCCLAFDYIGATINVEGRFENAELVFITSWLRAHMAGKQVLDVGANIGNHSLAFAETAASVIALEPHPLTYQLLSINVRNHPNIRAVALGASDRKAVVSATAPRNNLGMASIGLSSDGEQVSFQVAPLDELEGVANLGFMKIDVELHEEPALRGAEQLLRKHRPVVMMEQTGEVISGGTSPSVEFLRGLGYSCFYAVETQVPWSWGRKLPRPLQRIARLLEGLLLGVPEREAHAAPLSRLDSGRDYPCLIASTTPLD